MQRPQKPTHTAVSWFIATLLPPKGNDIPRVQHVPPNPRYDADTALVEQIVLSVTPTPGVYDFIGYRPTVGHTSYAAPIQPRQPRTLCFLHRPFTLDRGNVRKGTLVLSSHTSFDEVLTVGWNPVLAERLGINVGEALCVQGYKDDPERKIGIVGRVSVPRETLLHRIQQEFGAAALAHTGLSDQIQVVAIMNAFSKAEVQRVVDMVRERGWLQPDDDGKHILYLTGEPRESGVEAATALGISVACVGHRQAEDWGIKYLAAQLRSAFPNVRVEEVYEEEKYEKYVIRPRGGGAWSVKGIAG